MQRQNLILFRYNRHKVLNEKLCEDLQNYKNRKEMGSISYLKHKMKRNEE